MSSLHTFHIPVMGTGFSLDSPFKVARYGISSVLSLVDDTLIEQMRKFYCEKSGEPYTAITKYDEDFRARRITAYLDLLDRLIKQQFEDLKISIFQKGSEITKYFELLPESSPLKRLYLEMLNTTDFIEKRRLQEALRNSLEMGHINVNIMTKLDRPNYAQDGTLLPPEFSDALAALRGYAKSNLESSIVFSAGINQRLYSYLSEFKDFYADPSGYIKKKIVLKVSDYRSALIQGRFFAKKGLWVSEYRIESGLNCGGHAFATDGYLMGPILEEFKTKRQELVNSLHEVYNKAVALRDKFSFSRPHPIRITAQGGIGTAAEDQFLLSHYQLDATGWGTPFLLCPEATNVDEETLQKLAAATEDDLYLSEVSPLGVPFNNLRGSASDMVKEERSEKGRPGSPCPKGHLVSNTEFTKEAICTASRLYQKLKLDQLAKKNLSPEEYQAQYRQVTQKACICHDLGESALMRNEVPTNVKRFPAVCPGPNLAYFSKVVSLEEMVGHIYGRVNILNSTYRPHMFIKELKLYVDYLTKDVKKAPTPISERQVKYFREFYGNLCQGIEYYQTLIPKMLVNVKEFQRKTLQELEDLRWTLETFVAQNPLAFYSSESSIMEAKTTTS
ncbi:MAG: hypothetical protein NUV91_01450 [Candidatus Omnitrophica bacterium]|nr:hypothetical protein [Candidatus Omnitrophota bacterium]